VKQNRPKYHLEVLRELRGFVVILLPNSTKLQEILLVESLDFTGHTSVELSKRKNRIRNINGRQNYPLLIISQPSVHPPFQSSSYPFNSPKICHVDRFSSVTYRSQERQVDLYAIRHVAHSPADGSAIGGDELVESSSLAASDPLHLRLRRIGNPSML
jgi:hypothetical protein